MHDTFGIEPLFEKSLKNPNELFLLNNELIMLLRSPQSKQTKPQHLTNEFSFNYFGQKYTKWSNCRLKKVNLMFLYVYVVLLNFPKLSNP